MIPEMGLHVKILIEYLKRMNREEFEMHKSENVSFKNFVIVGEKEEAQLYKEAVRLVFKKRKMVVKIQPTQHLSQQHVLFAFRSHASRMAEKHFSQIQSSGLVGQWKQAFDLNLINLIKHNYDFLSNLTMRQFSFSKLFLGSVYERPEPQKLTMDHFLVPFLILCSAILLCTLSFIIEWITHLWNCYIILKLITVVRNQATQSI